MVKLPILEVKASMWLFSGNKNTCPYIPITDAANKSITDSFIVFAEKKGIENIEKLIKMQFG